VRRQSESGAAALVAVLIQSAAVGGALQMRLRRREAIMTTIKLWVSTIKSTFANIPALLVFTALYALLLVSAYFFISTREASLWQVFVTYALMILIPVEFFLFNAAIVDRERMQRFLWRAIFIDALKFFVITIPVLLIVGLCYYLLNKLGGRWPTPVVVTLPATSAAARPQPVHWPTLVFATLRFVLLGIAAPLALIHLWIAASGSELRNLVQKGAAALVKRIGSSLARAFAFESVLIYSLGLIVFFVLPYVVLFVPFSPKGNKADFTVFILRLLLTFGLSFIGWVVTISALTRNAAERPPEPSPNRSAAIAAEAAA